MDCTFVFISKDSLPNLRPWRFFPYILLLKFWCVMFYIQIYDPFWVNFYIKCEIYVNFFFFFAPPFIVKTIHWIAFAPFPTVIWLHLSGSIFVFSVPFHWYKSLGQYHSLGFSSFTVNVYCTSVAVILPVSFFFKNVLAVLIPLPIYLNFRISLSISVKNPGGTLIRIAWSIELNLKRVVIFTMLSLPVHKYAICLFNYLLISFISVSWCWIYRSYICFVRFMLKYLYFGDTW